MNNDQLITHARARFDHAAARKLLKEKYQAKMLFAYAGGMWCAGPTLLTLLQVVQAETDVVLLDLYDNPTKVNTSELQHLSLERWQEQMNAWLVEYNELAKQR